MFEAFRKIRFRVLTGSLLSFMGVVAFVAFSYHFFVLMENKIFFTDRADRIVNAILEVRRYEKNYLLYRQVDDFHEALRYFDQFQELISLDPGPIVKNVPPEAKSVLASLEPLVSEYRQAFSFMHDMLSSSESTPSRVKKLEDSIKMTRSRGQELVTRAEDLARKERKLLQKLLHRYRIFFGIFILLYILLAAGIVYFLEARVVKTLSTIEDAAVKVGRGDFQLIPIEQTGDEIGSMVRAFNQMVVQLQESREQMIQAEKLSSLGTLTGGVAHELNNPLSNISTSCQILLEEAGEGIGDYHKELLSGIEEQVIKARDIVRALLEFSRERDFELRPVYFREVVEDTLKLVKGEVPSNVEIQVDVEKGLVLDLDKAHMERALLNLTMNAFQAMQEGGTLTIRAMSDAGSGEAAIEIIDTGEGIPLELIPRIFDPFFTTKEAGGTGLGLSVTYGIIERHRGRIFAHSVVGMGTTFTIRLPLKGHKR